MSDIAANLAAITARMARAAQSAGREPDTVSLVAVSKTHSAEAIRPALEAGQRIFGENRVQEAKAKWPELKAAFPNAQLRLIGPLQTNKVREALTLFDVIETLDRPKLARVLAEEMARADRFPQCLIQVNTGREAQKGGVDPALADQMITLCRTEYRLPVTGVMCIPPADEAPEPHFRLLAELAARHNLSVVSMGMSSDFEAAISCGATHVRVGSAIFGSRPPHAP